MNEFKIKNGLVVDLGGAQITGSTNITGSLTVTGGITGSLLGTASFASTSSFIDVSGSNVFVQGGNSFGAQAILGTNDNQNLAFETSGSVRMFIASGSGNVGIGTDNPVSKLNVIGRAGISQRLRVGNTGDPNQTLEVWGDQTLVTSGGSVWGIFQQSNERIGIGTSSPTARLQIRGSGATSSTTALLIENSNTSASLTINDVGESIFTSTSSTLLSLNNSSFANSRYRLMITGDYSMQLLDNQGFGMIISNNGIVLNSRNNGFITLFTQAVNTTRLQLGGQDLNPTIARTRTLIQPVPSSTTLFQPTEGTAVDYSFTNPGNSTFSPTSGNASYTQIELRPTFNTTGTYSGTVRGLLYNPVLTSLTGSDHIAIQTNSGRVIFNSTDANSGFRIFNTGAGSALNGGVADIITNGVANSINLLLSNWTSYSTLNRSALSFIVRGSNGSLLDTSRIHSGYFNSTTTVLEFYNRTTEAGNAGYVGKWHGSNFMIGGTATDSPSQSQNSLQINTAPSNAIRVNGAGTTSILIQAGNLSGGTGTVELLAGSNNNSYLRLASEFIREGASGGLGINVARENIVSKFQVRGSGATSSTTALRIENNNASASFVVLDNSNVGVGIATPSASLHISSNSLPQLILGHDAANYSIFRSDNAGNLLINAVSGSNGNVSIYSLNGDITMGSTTAIGTIYLQRAISGVVGGFTSQNAVFSLFGGTLRQNHLNVISNGNIGIGTLAPGAKLHVSGANSDVLFEIDSPAVNNIIFVSGSGNVGIGTTSSTYRLDVSGSNARFNNSGGNFELDIASSTTIGRITAGSTLFAAGSLTSAPFVFWMNALERMRISTSGNLLVGTTSGLARLQVRGAGATSSTTGLRVENSNASASLVVLDNGNVGIGIPNPTSRLDISGSVLITGSLTVTGGITGSLLGTSTNAISSSYAISASYIFPYVGDALITGSSYITNIIDNNNTLIYTLPSFETLTPGTTLKIDIPLEYTLPDLVIYLDAQIDDDLDIYDGDIITGTKIYTLSNTGNTVGNFPLGNVKYPFITLYNTGTLTQDVVLYSIDLTVLSHTVGGDCTIDTVLTLPPLPVLPYNKLTGSLATSGSGADLKLYLYNGSSWNQV